MRSAFLGVGGDRTQTDEFAIHFTNIIQCLVAGSMSAKVHFRCVAFCLLLC